MTITLHWPQITILILWAFDLLYVAAHNGETKHEPQYNIVTTALSIALTLWLLIMGGFFS
jgi:hypothetical protein